MVVERGFVRSNLIELSKKYFNRGNYVNMCADYVLPGLMNSKLDYYHLLTHRLSLAFKFLNLYSILLLPDKFFFLLQSWSAHYGQKRIQTEIAYIKHLHHTV